ncbi:magnesium transporter [Patescibacteria group bacterium]|nr:MAG: magnesium transporter [Patescibacteria group bacterium]
MRRNGLERQRAKSHFPPDAAARRMLLRIPTAPPEETVSSARRRLTDPKAVWDSVSYVYVVDDERHLLGVVSIKELLRSDGMQAMRAFAKRNLAVVHPHSDVRVAAARAIARGVKMLPVVDHDGTLMGAVGTDEILSTLEAEHVRSVLSASGLAATRARFSEVIAARLPQLIAWRTPWLVVGLFGGMLATLLVDGFRQDLESVIALAFFIPVIVYMGDAVGTQTQTIYVRSLALEALDKRHYFAREVAVDATMGLVSALLIGPFALLLTGMPQVAAIVSLSMFLVMVAAGPVAIAIPELLRKFGRDPAVGGGPFTTIVQDLLSLSIYFAVASWLLI